MFEFCQDLNTKATEAVSHVNMRMLCQATSKRRGEKESVEDFIRRVECQSKGCLESLEPYVVAEATPEVQVWEGYAPDQFNVFQMLNH